MLYLSEALCYVVSLRAGTLPCWLSQIGARWFLKFQLLSPTDCEELVKLNSSGFQSQSYGIHLSASPLCLGCLVWHLFLSLFCTYSASASCKLSLQFSLVANCVSALLTLFDMASSLHLALKSLFCQSSGCFLGYVCWCGCYLGISMGWVAFRILLLRHLPCKFIAEVLILSVPCFTPLIPGSPFSKFPQLSLSLIAFSIAYCTTLGPFACFWHFLWTILSHYFFNVILDYS